MEKLIEMTPAEVIDELGEMYWVMSQCLNTEDCIRHNTAIDIAIEAIQEKESNLGDGNTELEAVIRTPNTTSGIEYPYCPTCGNRMTSARASFMRKGKVYPYAYCESCGQKVKWS